MPFIVSLTTACCMLAGVENPAAWCALVIEVSLRSRLAGLWPAAKSVRYRATVSGAAGRQARPWLPHHASNWRQSER